MDFIFANLLTELENWRYWISNPLTWVLLGFQIWMLVDAIRREEYFWAVMIFLFSFISAILYFFLVYRASGGALTGRGTRGFELPGAHDRRRIKELEAQIHHLDKAHHHSQLGDIYFQQGKLAQAEGCYRAAMERDAEDIDTRAHLGQCFLRQERPAEARLLLDGVCSEDPKHDYGHSLMALAETQAMLGEKEVAMETWKRVMENHAYPRARVQLAELYLGRGEKEAARSLLNEVLVEDPHAPAFQRKREKVWVRRARALMSQTK